VTKKGGEQLGVRDPAASSVGAGELSDVESLAAEVEAAQDAVAALDPDARQVAERLQKAIEAFHRPGLVQLTRLLRDDPRGKELLFEAVDDPAVRAIFALHGIIRPDPRTRANQALDRVRPMLQSHGGDVELIEIEGNTAVVRLLGSCTGCSMSAVTLRELVQDALVNGVAEIEAVRVDEGQATTAFIPLADVGRRGNRSDGWVAGPALDDVDPSVITRFDYGDDSFVITNVANRIAVFRNVCAHQGFPLDDGLLSEGVLSCARHGFAYDASTGECLSAPAAQLQPVPARIVDGVVMIRPNDD